MRWTRSISSYRDDWKRRRGPAGARSCAVEAVCRLVCGKETAGWSDVLSRSLQERASLALVDGSSESAGLARFAFGYLHADVYPRDSSCAGQRRGGRRRPQTTAACSTVSTRAVEREEDPEAAGCDSGLTARGEFSWAVPRAGLAFLWRGGGGRGSGAHGGRDKVGGAGRVCRHRIPGKRTARAWCAPRPAPPLSQDPGANRPRATLMY